MRRRDFLRSAALAPLAGPLASVQAATAGLVSSVKAPGPAPRLVVLDWGLVETLLAIGVTPVGVSEIAAYNESVITPRVPAHVPDVGLRLAPSLELLQQLAPDLILINLSQESQREMLERIAPVRSFAVYTDAGAPLHHSQQVTLQLAELCGRANVGQVLIDTTDRVLATSREQIVVHRVRRQQSTTPRPLYLIRFFDGRHVGVYGARSLFQDVMDALDVSNAWHGPTDYWGIGVAGLEKLAASPTADLLYFDPLPTGVARTLASNRLWHALPAVAGGRVATLPPFWGFGMLPSAVRFAGALSTALTQDTALTTPVQPQTR
ncbi:ABC transporter substrate-binding protein [Caballeronia sp. INDeC2]|uniref:ABC transporter substrate-binding protein n=1 Tax=Caballeronia sp. INDeC2 TaxID=2921747 RepID=UPI002027AFE9|nr:ABC transporter substrate-binding protein [Caballeronia sp. INDeC2]